MKTITKNELSLDEIEFYWKLCDTIGADKRKDLHKLAGDLGCNSYEFFMADCDEVCIFYFDDKTVIACDGSDKDPEEWKGNFSPYEFGEIFETYFRRKYESVDGFHADYYETAMLIQKKLDSVLPKDKPRVYIGHSRGGGIIQQVNFFDDPEIAMAVTFGSPRTMLRWRREVAKELGVIHHRVKIKRDVVDNVPPALLGWRHQQTKKYSLRGVRGKFNHTAFGDAIKAEKRRKNGRKRK